VVLQISKFVLVTLANHIVLTAGQPSDRSSLIEKALCQIPNPSADCMIRDVAKSIGHRMHAADVKLKYNLPDRNCINSVILLSWSTATGLKESLSYDVQQISQLIRRGSSPCLQPELLMTCKEALEVLTVMFMLSPEVLSHLFSSESQSFSHFIIDLVLICSEK
jgi:ubiquitin carboxyl-terminal hydrolase 9/24